MTRFDSILKQLRQERDNLNKAIVALEGLTGKSTSTRMRGNMSVAARKRISAAQKARWAKWKKQNKAA